MVPSVGGMQKYLVAAMVYTGLGLAAGLLYRTLTHDQESWAFTQLNVAHTHLLVLGTIFMLLFLALERLFQLREGRWHRTFWMTYNAGVGLSATMMIVNGILQLAGADEVLPGMRAGVAGIGHILITVAFVCFFVNLWSRLPRTEKNDASVAEERD